MSIISMDSQSQAKPSSGRPLGSVGARGRRQRLVEAYVAKLGGDVSALQLQDIERAVDLDLLARAARSKALRGEESLGNVTRLEIQASKAVKRLNLPAAGAVAAPVQTVADYWAARSAAPEEAEE
jgi:hypothetical protein